MASIEQAAGEAGSDGLGALLRVSLNDNGSLQPSAVQTALGGSLPVDGSNHSLAPNSSQIRWTVGSQPGRGPIVIDNKDNLFVVTNDPTLYMGYNQDANGNRIQAAEPGLSWCIEGDYDDGSGQNKMEAYLQYVKADNTPPRLRPIFIQLNRATDGVTALAFTGPDIRLQGQAGTTMLQFQDVGTLNFYAQKFGTYPATMAVQISVDSALFSLSYGVTANALRFQTDTDIQSSISVGATTMARLYKSGAGGCLAVGGANDNSAVIIADNTATQAANVVMIARGHATQANDIFQAQNSASTPLSGIRKDGLIYSTTNALATKTKAGTPADADWATAPPDGTLVVDSTGSKIWARVGGVWKGVVIA